MVWPTTTIISHGTNTVVSNQRRTPVARDHLEHICDLILGPQNTPNNVRLTGIICTIGPACQDVAVLEAMIEAGMNIARLNLSHGSHAYHAQSIRNIRSAVDRYSARVGVQCPVAIALDTKGSEIRTGLLAGGGSAEVELKQGEIIKLTTDKAYAEKGNANIIFVDYANIHKVVQVGNRIFIDDGLISLECIRIEGSTLTCTILNGGSLGSQKSVNLPGIPIDLPSVSQRDKLDLQFGIEQGIDMIFATFTRDRATICEIRRALDGDNPVADDGNKIAIVAKIENQQGLDNLDEIIDEADGVLVERGDLGTEIPTEKVFLVQKTIIARCNKAGKPVICATQMLESMVHNPRPTRAESCDVANAVLDGADCVMLSGETAKGDYPVDCVRTMANICKEAEAAIWEREFIWDIDNNKTILSIDGAHTAAIAAVEASANSQAAAIIVVTTTGRSAYLIAKYRPKCPIIVVTSYAQTAKQAHLYRALCPIHYPETRLCDWVKDVDARVNFGIDFGKSKQFIKATDSIVVVTGWKEDSGFTNTMRIVNVE